MTALIVYESMYGNTRAIAEAVAEGLRTAHQTAVVSAAAVDPDEFAEAALVVVGGPTHVHSLPRPSSRRAAEAAVAKSGGALVLEPGAQGPGVREWLDSLAQTGAKPGDGK